MIYLIILLLAILALQQIGNKFAILTTGTNVIAVDRIDIQYRCLFWIRLCQNCLIRYRYR
jgi:hypothetical protein